MKTLSLITLGFGSLLFMNSCTKDVGPDPALLPKVFTCDSVKFGSTIKPIIDASCATPGCHVPGGSGPGDFTTFADISLKVQTGSFKSYVIDGVPSIMPKGGPRLPDDQIEKIKCWLDAGAPNN